MSRVEKIRNETVKYDVQKMEQQLGWYSHIM
jgi:hypothetical protein